MSAAKGAAGRGAAKGRRGGDGRRPDALYRGEYAVCLYRGDELVAVLDNAPMFAAWMGISKEDARVRLHLMLKGRIPSVIVADHKETEVHFVKLEEDGD